MIQACSNFHCARVFIPNTRPGEISKRDETEPNDSVGACPRQSGSDSLRGREYKAAMLLSVCDEPTLHFHASEYMVAVLSTIRDQSTFPSLYLCASEYQETRMTWSKMAI